MRLINLKNLRNQNLNFNNLIRVFERRRKVPNGFERKIFIIEKEAQVK